MKKIFLVLFSLITLTSVFAQSDHTPYGKNESHTVVYNKPGHNYNANERDAQQQRINREFDRKIQDVKRDRHITSFEKDRQVRSLERQRTQQIQAVNDRFFPQKEAYKDNRFARRNTHRW